MNPLHTALVSVLILATSAVAAEKAEVNGAVDIAERYLDAYSSFDIEKMAHLISDEMVFTDPTKPPELNDGESFTHIGKQAILSALGGYAKLYEEFYLDYQIVRRFESNGVVVFIGDVTYNILTEDAQSLTGTAPIVTVVTVKEGKVVQHLDLYDYAGNAVNFSE